MSGEFVTFEDETVIISVPSYLKKKRSLRYFRADRRKIKRPAVTDLGVDVWSDKAAFVMFRDNLANTVKRDQTGGTDQLLRWGESGYNGIGYESLWRFANQNTGVELLRYDVVFHCKDKVVTICIIGQDDGELFYLLCKDIVMSFDLK